MDTYVFLQHYWWFLISLLGALLVFLLFVQGGQGLLYTIGKTEEERNMIVNSLGRKWEFTFTTLVTFGGAFFASFPLFYSTSFGGAFYVWMLILLVFVIQAVAYEFRRKPNNFLGEKSYNAFLVINGIAGTFLLGAAVGTLFTGANFTVDRMNLGNISGVNTISQWTTPWRGLEALTDYRNWALGLAVLFLSRILGLQYFLNNIDDETIAMRSRKHLVYNTGPFLICFLTFLISLLLLGIIAVLWGIGTAIFKGSRSSIWFSGIGTIVTVLSMLLLAGYNNTAYYPSLADTQSSLTIYNSSSSLFTLKAMSFVSLLIPFVVAYIWYAWRAMNQKPISRQEVNSEEHLY